MAEGKTTEGKIDILSKMRKMGRVERRLRKWWMQRQLWKAYRKVIEMVWAKYEAANAAQNKILSNTLFLEMIEFRKHFEAGRAAIDAAFETIPMKMLIDDDEVVGT